MGKLRPAPCLPPPSPRSPVLAHAGTPSSPCSEKQQQLREPVFLPVVENQVSQPLGHQRESINTAAGGKVDTFLTPPGPASLPLRTSPGWAPTPGGAGPKPPAPGASTGKQWREATGSLRLCQRAQLLLFPFSASFLRKEGCRWACPWEVQMRF